MSIMWKQLRYPLPLPDVQTKTFSVSNISLQNLPDGSEAHVYESSILITVRGIPADIKRLTAEEIMVVVDVRNQVLPSGQTVYPRTLFSRMIIMLAPWGNIS